MSAALLRPRTNRRSTRLSPSGLARAMGLSWVVAPHLSPASYHASTYGDSATIYGVSLGPEELLFDSLDRIVRTRQTQQANNGEITLFARFRATSSATTMQQLICEDPLSGTRVFQFRINTGGVEFIPFSSAGANTNLKASTVTVGAVYTAVASYRPGYQYVRLYNSNGALVAHDDTTVSQGINFNASTVTKIGSANDEVSGFFTGGMEIAGGGGRYIGPAQADALVADPHQLFERRRVVVPFVFTAPVTPTAPTIGTTTSITQTGATVNWTDNSADETGFKVEYSPSPYSSWTAAATTAADATNYVLTGLTEKTTYKARVASTNANGDSAWVESAEFTTLAVPRGSLLGVG